MLFKGNMYFTRLAKYVIIYEADKLPPSQIIAIILTKYVPKPVEIVNYLGSILLGRQNAIGIKC